LSDGLWGPYRGTVTINKDPLNLGRVKIEIPGVYGDGKQVWANVCSPSAGTNRGVFFTPEVNDEVWVLFEGGDPDFPVVMGSFWIKNDRSGITKADEEITLSKIKTKGEHEVTFNFKSGEEKIEIKTKTGENVTLENSKSILIKDKDNKNYLKIDTSGKTITIESESKIEIKCGGNKVKIDTSGVSIESTGQLKIKGASVNIQADGALNLKAGGMLNVKSDGLIGIKGSMVKIN
jgi:uncharacterized protein involved in type VI secretion and phage assembly